MERRSPTLEGFRVLFRLPSLALAEIAWRWSFGLAATALLAFSLREYLSTLPVTAADIFMLQTRQPALVLHAIARILRGSAPRAVTALIVLAIALTFAWIVLASLARAATLRMLFEYFPENGESRPRSWRLTSLIGLNFLRAGALLAAVVGVVGAVLLGGAASSATDPSPAGALLIFWMLTLFIGLAWSMLNWYLTLAAVFAVGEGKTSFGALAAAVELIRNHPGPVAAAATWFGLVHGLAFVVATSVAAFPLGLAEVLPGGVVFGGLLLIALLYFAAVDSLYVGRLAAYVFMIDQPKPRPQSDDDILSDIPGLVPPLKTAEG
jgi:hypothetical protein